MIFDAVMVSFEFYALGAVLYKAVTGKYVIDAMERKINDELAPPIQLNGQISKGFINAVMKALELDYIRNIIGSG